MARILIIEDEAVLRLTFQEFLEEEGHEVAAAEDYDEAMGHIENSPVDIVVTDIILSGKTGVDILRTLRSRGLNCPVIMITGEPNVETAAEAVRLGAFDYIPKPVTGEALKRVVRLAADQHKLQTERDLYAQQMDKYRRELEAIFNSVNEGIITVDGAMRVRQINQTAQNILSLKSTPAGLPLSDILPGALGPILRAIEHTVAKRESVPDTRIEINIPKIGERILIFQTTPLERVSGEYQGAVLTFRDVTRLSTLERQVEASQRYRDMIGKSPRMQEIFALIRELAETDSTALICGESGTGKELVAAALHYESGRAKGPFLKVNCAALSENILESELFGHVKGAFTGAVRDRVGRFEAADGGTILLDEIGDISPRLQLRLLRVLQEHEFERVGDSKPIHVDVRVVASTNRDLVKRIQEGEFRQDLYYRLNVVRIEIPPLRERREDIPLLVEHFRVRFNQQLKREIVGLSAGVMDIFMNYAWPGNVREMENCMERAFILCRGNHIQVEHLPAEIVEAHLLSQGSPMKTQGAISSGAISAPAARGYARRPDLDRERVLQTLRQTDWNVAKASRLLGVARNTLYQKMRSLDLVRPSE